MFFLCFGDTAEETSDTQAHNQKWLSKPNHLKQINSVGVWVLFGWLVWFCVVSFNAVFVKQRKKKNKKGIF